MRGSPESKTNLEKSEMNFSEIKGILSYVTLNIFRPVMRKVGEGAISVAITLENVSAHSF